MWWFNQNTEEILSCHQNGASNKWVSNPLICKISIPAILVHCESENTAQDDHSVHPYCYKQNLQSSRQKVSNSPEKIANVQHLSIIQTVKIQVTGKKDTGKIRLCILNIFICLSLYVIKSTQSCSHFLSSSCDWEQKIQRFLQQEIKRKQKK